MSNLLAQLTTLLPLAAKWVEEQEATILANGTPLTSQALADGKAVGVAHPEKIRVIYGPSMPVPADPFLLQVGKEIGLIGPNITGMSFRYGIFLRNDGRHDRRLLAHECAHTAQYERLGGILQFLTQYGQECLSLGYPGSPLEQEALQKAADIVP
jgi:hypothetical protein